MTIEINGCGFSLLYEKALYKSDESLLIIADVHLGKATHFRKAGIAIPANAQHSDYENLKLLFNKVQPAQVYFLGDLFHSSINNDWYRFCDLIEEFPTIKFTLVKGNHDLINKKQFGELCIEVTDSIEDERFLYTHAPVADVPTGKVNIVGHIHPGIVLSGLGRQSLRLPCFYTTDTLVILPAFGTLTGTYPMDRTRETRIYVVLPDSVRQV